MIRWCLGALVGFAAIAGCAALAPAADRARVEASADAVTIRVPNAAQDVEVRAARPYQADDEGDVVFRGRAADGVVRVPRMRGGVDLLFSRFVVKSAAGSTVAWAGAFPGTDERSTPWPKEIKGVSNPEDEADLVALGVRHVHINIKLGDVLLADDARTPRAELVRESNGRTLRFDPKRIAGLDRSIARMTADGINVVVVFLNGIDDHARALGLVNPKTVAKPPQGLGAFNLSDERGIAAFAGALRFLAERYDGRDAARGRIGGFIVGNEVDSHSAWHNMGPADLEAVAQQYVRELRLADLAVRGLPVRTPVFASLTHSWSRPNSTQPLRNCSGKALLDRLTELSRAEGDFAWDVAYHPYPQNLFKPDFWNDRMAMFGYDSPMITFKNVELLPAYLRRDEMRCDGKPRRVILSEQGFHANDDAEGERLQAAAFALAYWRVAHVDGIDAFILHRHVDAPGEGGLNLGLRTFAEGKSMGEKRKSWNVFEAAGTSRFEQVASFALGVAGLKSWDEALPRKGPFPEHAPEWQQFKTRDAAMFDLVAMLPQADVRDAMDVKQRTVALPDGGMAESIFLHPKQKSEPPATATFSLPLPADRPARLVFQTYLGKAKSKGVVFRVRVDGKVVFSRAVRDQAMADGSVDLAPFKGRTVALALEADCDGDNSYDEAEWIAPAVVAAGGNATRSK